MQQKFEPINDATGIKISLQKLPDTDLVVLNISKSKSKKSIEVVICDTEALIVALEFDIPIKPPAYEVI